MIASSRILLAAAVLATSFSASMLQAASARGLARWTWDGPVGTAPEGVQPGLRTPDGRACVKQCPADTLPCDPPAFKQADGRCSTMWH